MAAYNKLCRLNFSWRPRWLRIPRLPEINDFLKTLKIRRDKCFHAEQLAELFSFLMRADPGECPGKTISFIGSRPLPISHHPHQRNLFRGEGRLEFPGEGKRTEGAILLGVDENTIQLTLSE